jgi:hypothetical protein
MLQHLNLTNLKITDTSLCTAINGVYEKARELLDNPLHIHFTNHKIDHSERILQDIDKLIDKPERLSEKEKFVLICAVLLHDIGMQMEQYVPETITDREEILKNLRENHHEYSAKAIVDSVQLDIHDKYYLNLGGKREYVEFIALVAKNHRLKFDITDIEDDYVGSETIHQKLLCALIRLGDCLDIDSRRVNIELLKAISIPTGSKFFWYSHHYVSAHIINRQTITIKFRFPKKYETEKVLVEGIILHIKNEIKKHLDNVYQILFNHDVRINAEVCTLKEEYSRTTVEEMPADLVEYIKENSKMQQEGYKSEDGLGEIEFYWGGIRETANEKIIKYIIDNDLNEIFISAIGFGTVSSVLENEKVKKKLKEKIDQNKLKITFVLPGSFRELLSFRQDIDEDRLLESYQKGKELLKNFRKDLADKCFPTESEEEKSNIIAKYIEIKKYKGSVPRHFILYGSDGTIFFGSYLGHTTGKKSYMMKLKAKENSDENNKLNNGLFTLFMNEIDYLKIHSKERDL